MIIKKLIVTAFGPYATRQELDFEMNLKDHNMFVVTGTTGAGKTTIFDAINFVLYGEASGSDRDGRSLRSDFAEPTSRTEVEFWFSLKGKEYYIKRSPQYFRKKQRGEGQTESKAEAELIYEGKTVSGTKEVTRQVEEILGITSEQFKQLVMIPQGEFKKLLTSDSGKKEEIFRKIFGTKVFSDIQQNIKKEANSLKNSIELVLRDRENKIKSFILRKDSYLLEQLILNKNLNVELILDEFQKVIELDEAEEKALEENEEALNNNLENLSKELALAKEINKKLDTLETNKRIFEELNALKEEFILKEEEVKYAKKAESVLKFEERYEEKGKSREAIRKSLQISIDNIKRLQVNLEKAENQFKNELDKEPLKNELIKRLDEIQGLKQKALVYKEKSEELALLKEGCSKLSSRIEFIKKEIDNNSKLLKDIDKDISNINNLKDELANLNMEHLKNNSKCEKLNLLSMNFNKLIEKLSYEKKLELEYSKSDNIYNNKKRIYENLDEIFRRNLAGNLAKDLEEGCECPVCGSKSHPKLAIFDDKNISENEVKNAKLEEDKARKTMEEALNLLTNHKAEIKVLKNDNISNLFKEIFGDISDEDLYKDISLKADKINNELIILENILKKNILRKKEIEKKISQEDTLNKNKNKIENDSEALREELENKNKEILDKSGEVKTQQANLENIINDFNGVIKSIDELNIEEKNKNLELNNLKLAYEKAEKYLKDIKSRYDKEIGNRETLEAQEKLSTIELDKAKGEFIEKISSSGFENYKEYRSKKREESQINRLEDAINKYKLDLSNAEKLYSVSVEECKELKQVDLERINTLISEGNKEKEKINKFIKEIYSRINNNKNILRDCISFNKKIEVDEERYKTIGALAKIINGDNPRKISFERYVLATYFEDIISAANIRFSKMTNSRFELSRKEEIGDMRKGQGLDLQVFDNYTGKNRDVKTLSGGESFKASLAMALGLSDVVQRYSGGIQLDTIFIDEGFGTLDPESLDVAIDTLIDLQDSGRVVGIISHVQELKDRIEAKIEVTSTNKGSKAEFRV